MIHRMQAKGFMGLRLVEYEFGAAGAVLAGRNGGGKTSVLKAIRAALSAQGISADAVSTGADAAEVLIDLDDVTVRRRITATGKGSLTITRSDGSAQPSPQAYLTELLGVAPLDPIDLVAGGATAAERKARADKLLAAMPVTVGAEQLARWAPDVDLVLALGAVGGKPDTSGHGLEVLGRVRAAAYDARTTANRLVKDARVAVDQAMAVAQQARQDAFGAADTPSPPDGLDPVAWAQERIVEAATAEARAMDSLNDTRARAAAYERAAGAGAKARERVAVLREKARSIRERAPTVPSDETWADASDRCSDAAQAVAAAEGEVRRLEGLLREAQAVAHEAEIEHADRQRQLAQLEEARQDAEEGEREALAVEAQAAELEEASGGACEPVDLAPAIAHHDQQRAALASARAAARFFELLAQVDAAQGHEIGCQERAQRLDAQVQALTKDAPAALMAGGGVPGLEVDGTDIRLDGVSIDRLSSAEQLRFAVRIARRLNARSKLLVIDGLERVDPEQLPAFIEEATADGYQLLATRVAAGDVHVEPIGGAA